MTNAQAEWARCRSWIEAALKFSAGMYEIEDVETSIADGSMVFIPGEYSAVVLEIVIFPKGKMLSVFLGGGERGQAIEECSGKMDACITAYAKANECKWVKFLCRPGVEHYATKLGYRKQWSVMIKDVE